jgi:hypothetical protein
MLLRRFFLEKAGTSWNERWNSIKIKLSYVLFTNAHKSTVNFNDKLSVA